MVLSVVSLKTLMKNRGVPKDINPEQFHRVGCSYA